MREREREKFVQALILVSLACRIWGAARDRKPVAGKTSNLLAVVKEQRVV